MQDPLYHMTRPVRIPTWLAAINIAVLLFFLISSVIQSWLTTVLWFGGGLIFGYVFRAAYRYLYPEEARREESEIDERIDDFQGGRIAMVENELRHFTMPLPFAVGWSILSLSLLLGEGIALVKSIT